jgi:hypothetical protein
MGQGCGLMKFPLKALEEKIPSMRKAFSFRGKHWGGFLYDHGKILDLWGTPYRLTLNEDILEVVSARPDKRFGDGGIFDDNLVNKWKMPDLNTPLKASSSNKRPFFVKNAGVTSCEYEI